MSYPRLNRYVRRCQLRNRVRIACSLGAVLGGLFMAGDVFGNVSSAELGSLVRDAVRDLAAAPAPKPAATRAGTVPGASVRRPG